MDEEKNCKKCSLRINFKADLYTVCEGYCAGFFHASCVGLIEDVLCVLSSSNIIWMCDKCISKFRKLRDEVHYDPANDATSVNKTVADEVKLLKTVVAGIQHTLSSIVNAASNNELS